MNCKNAAFIALLALGLASANAGEPKWFAVPASANAPALVADLSDPVWAKALKIPFTKLNDAPGDTAKYPTETYWLYANGSLFIGFNCVNPSSPKLWATPNQLRDAGIYNNECVELFLGDFDGGLYYQIVVDAAGNMFDLCNKDGRWNGDWTCVTSTQTGHWTAVVEIPKDILDRIWKPGSFLTLDLVRHGLNPDGSGAEVTAISPPGVHSPEDRLFLGSVSAAALGEKASAAAAKFKEEFAKAPRPQDVADQLAAMEVFAATCAKSTDIGLERYRALHQQYAQFGQRLTGLKQDIVLNVIFGSEG